MGGRETFKATDREHATRIPGYLYVRLKADFQSSHEAPRSSLRVLASN